METASGEGARTCSTLLKPQGPGPSVEGADARLVGTLGFSWFFGIAALD